MKAEDGLFLYFNMLLFVQCWQRLLVGFLKIFCKGKVKCTTNNDSFKLLNKGNHLEVKVIFEYGKLWVFCSFFPNRKEQIIKGFDNLIGVLEKKREVDDQIAARNLPKMESSRFETLKTLVEARSLREKYYIVLHFKYIGLV